MGEAPHPIAQIPWKLLIGTVMVFPVAAYFAYVKQSGGAGWAVLMGATLIGGYAINRFRRKAGSDHPDDQFLLTESHTTSASFILRQFGFFAIRLFVGVPSLIGGMLLGLVIYSSLQTRPIDRATFVFIYGAVICMSAYVLSFQVGKKSKARNIQLAKWWALAFLVVLELLFVGRIFP